MKARLRILLLLPFCLCSCGEPEPPLFERPFQNIDGFSYRAFYSDRYFSGNSSQGDIRLASLAISSSMVSRRFISKEEPRQTKYVEDFMRAIGMEDVYFSPSYYEEPTETSIAFGIASKKMRRTTLVWTFVLGLGYEKEWISNLDIGVEGDSHGFAVTAEKVVEGLNEYVGRRAIQDDLSLFVTGYSRGAAVANLVGAHYDDLMEKGKTRIGDASLSFNDTYVYGVETPATTSRADPQGEKYRNIHNYMDFNDVIPMVPFEQWGLRQLGQRHYFPARLTDIRYEELQASCLQVMEGSGQAPAYLGDTWKEVSDEATSRYPSFHQFFLNQTNHVFSEVIGTREEFALYYQDAFGRLIYYCLGDSRFPRLVNAIQSKLFIFLLRQGDINAALDLISQEKYTEAKQKILDLCGSIYRNEQDTLQIIRDFADMIEPLFPLLKKAIGVVPLTSAMGLVKDMASLTSFHVSTTSQCWCMVCDEQYRGDGKGPFDNDGTYYKLTVSPVEDFSLALADGKSVFIAEAGKIVSSALTASINADQLTVCLPKNASYTYVSSNAATIQLKEADWYGVEKPIKDGMPGQGSF